MISSEDRYWIWLCSIPSIYRKEQCALLQYFKEPEAIFKASDAEFRPWKDLKLAWVPSILKCKNERYLEQAVHPIESGRVSFIKNTDPKFPKKLTEIADTPYGLFYRGSLPDPEKRSAAIIGARNCSAYGAGMARQIADAVSSLGMETISGMAMGIDSIAQRQCIRANAKTFGVLGCGVDICYPPESADLYDVLIVKGGVISEFGCGMPPLGHHFPMRNRIISGLADVVIVVEARKKSGTLITVDCALDQSRDVFTVPGRTDDELSAGCNHLIAQGAGIIESAESLIEVLTDRFKELKGKRLPQVTLAPEEKLVYSYLDLSPRGIDSLSRATRLEPRKLMLILMQLQMKGMAAEAGRNQFVRKQ